MERGGSHARGTVYRPYALSSEPLPQPLRSRIPPRATGCAPPPRAGDPRTACMLRRPAAHGRHARQLRGPTRPVRLASFCRFHRRCAVLSLPPLTHTARCRSQPAALAEGRLLRPGALHRTSAATKSTPPAMSRPRRSSPGSTPRALTATAATRSRRRQHPRSHAHFLDVPVGTACTASRSS